MNKEIWRDIDGYEGLYQVSNLGRVKSLKRKVYAGRGRTRWQYERIMSSGKTNGNKYKIVSLFKDGKGKNFYIHRLVANAFIENPNNYKYINHKDENPSNNFVNNLEWCTAEYNNTYNNKHIRVLETRMKKHIGCRKIAKLDENDNILKEYISISQASKEMGVSNQAISDCLRGKQKHSAGYKWKYTNI